jgi:hypothetical protein
MHKIPYGDPRRRRYATVTFHLSSGAAIKFTSVPAAEVDAIVKSVTKRFAGENTSPIYEYTFGSHKVVAQGASITAIEIVEG